MELIVFSEVKWNYLRTRKRFILSNFPGDTRVIFFEPIRFSRRNDFLPKTHGNVTYVCTPVLKPSTESRLYNWLTRFGAVRAVLDLVIVVWVRLLMLALRPRSDSPVLVSNVYFAPVVESMKSRFVCYDCNDDPTFFPGVPPWAVQYFNRLCRRADAVVACSASLARRLEDSCGKRVTVIGNGVDYELFSRAVEPREIPSDIAALPEPVVGYTGAVKEWFDFELLARSAKENPRASFAVVGPVSPSVAREAARLSGSLRNVHFLGEKPYASLPLYLAPMQVCLIPFVMSPLTAVLNPNKLYEYFAAGKTVVSLKYSCDLAAFGSLMYLAERAEGFPGAVSRALEAPLDAGRLKEAASGHTWRKKADELYAILISRGHSKETAR
ncbi:MAG: glycosyltransferase [Candidatus Eisenbacteria bacterium]